MDCSVVDMLPNEGSFLTEYMGHVSIPYCAEISDDDVTPSLNRGVCGKCEIYREGYVELFSGKTAMAGGAWHVSTDDEAISPFPFRRRAAADSSRIWRVDLTRSKAIDANDDRRRRRSV